MKWTVGITILLAGLLGASGIGIPVQNWPLLRYLYMLRTGILFEDCGSQYDVLSIRLSSCSSSPCTMPRGSNVTVNAEFTSNGSPTTSTLKHEAYFILNAIKTKATITPTTCEGVACPLQSDLGLLFSASIYVNPTLPALRGKLRWELKNDSKEVVLCYQVPISIS
ncbi:epididymal secretory protein E1 [Aedes aegypti]|uniref:MD-2-related lipid-recognition domain-containing protein n=1 Tax=Aedes aegypti TaxID=7159 RepID=A0A6I8U5B4_AEDAE|nr:epididymal secretory protein E1 [Aedes aegypti]